MSLTRKLGSLGRNDARMISRDGFLLTMVGYILGITVVLRYALPWLNETLAAREGIEIALSTYYPVAVAFIAVFNGALLGGVLVGFLLLEEREDDTIHAMLVTPLPVPTYLTYRVILPTVVGFASVFAQLLILGNLVPLAAWKMAAIAAGAAFMAPIAALFFATYAENKVQGFALMKFTGIAGFMIGASWFVNTPLQYLFGLFPPYWVSKAYWLAVEGVAWWPAALVLGIVLQIAMTAWLMGRFNATIYKDA